MHTKDGYFITLIILFAAVLSTVLPEASYAQTNCYGSINAGTPPMLGAFLKCMIPRAWQIVQYLMIGIAIVVLMWRIFHTVINRENSKELEQMPTQWFYTIIFLLLAVGAGGTVLNLVFKLLGLGDLSLWINPLNSVLDWLDSFTTP